MKKSQLRNIIRESIKELMDKQPLNEQYDPGPNTDPHYNWSTIQDAYTAVQNQNWHYVNPSDSTQGNVVINYQICVDQAIDGGYLDASAQTGGGVFGLVCSGVGTSASDLNFFNSPFQLNINTPPTGISLMDAANDPNSGFYDQGSCQTACTQYQQSQLIPGCRYPNACNYNPLATTGGASLCTWGPNGPNYGSLENPHPCPSTSTPTNPALSGNELQNADVPALNIDRPFSGTSPDPSDPGMKRMKDLAFKGKR